MSKQKYESNCQQRILRVLVHLFGHEVHGLAPGEIAKALSINAANVTHDLANLKIAGLAEQIQDSGRWRLTPRLPQRALAMLNEIERCSNRVNEVQQRYTRTPT
ncbi:MAG: hypothetical protein AB1513_12040 [Pseudomonadota bacterium]